tara:strand:+ start:1935 stop:3311 length:1377 start_codon:yes stop_codon:yes gene_type:complete
MNKQVVETTDAAETELLLRILSEATDVFVKKLSNNDRGWAKIPKQNKQDGPYIPREQRDARFFPPLVRKERPDPDSPEIREVFFDTHWPAFGVVRNSRLVNYRSKDEETHLTGVPREAFSELSPASFLLIGRTVSRGATRFDCLTIDSASDTASILIDRLELEVGFEAGILSPAIKQDQLRDQLLAFADEVLAAWRRGQIERFAEERGAIPDTATLAGLARQEYLMKQGRTTLDPYELTHPGDAIREISRVIELRIFREHQLRACAVSLVRLLVGDDPKKASVAGIARRLIESVREIDALMLSASQQRRSRAGYSFEHHIEALLQAGKAPYEKQVVIEARKRPDFILPSLKHLRKPSVGQDLGLILSAKTTLRERWKQVQREMGGNELFLATVDENIAGNAIADMATLGIYLVVPEALKAGGSGESAVTEYHGHTNVLSFRQWFDDVLAPRLSSWACR